jgi:hypothetical protein
VKLRWGLQLNHHQPTEENDMNWDPIKPEPVFNDDGQCIGKLMPRMTQEQLAVSPGIQGWSRPEVDTRFQDDEPKTYELEVLLDDGETQIVYALGDSEFDAFCAAHDDLVSRGFRPTLTREVLSTD